MKKLKKSTTACLIINKFKVRNNSAFSVAEDCGAFTSALESSAVEFFIFRRKIRVLYRMLVPNVREIVLFFSVTTPRL